jgi:hypothetical protein
MRFWKALFRRPPSTEELTAKDTTGPSRRASVRHPHGKMAFGEVIALPANKPILFKVKDISLGGLGLICEEHVMKGAFLAIKLEGSNYTRTLRARVIHVTPQGRSFLLGCRLLDELTSEELESLL